MIVKAEPAGIMLFSRVLPDGATEGKYLRQRVPVHRTKCHLGGQRPWLNCMAYTTDGKRYGQGGQANRLRAGLHFILSGEDRRRGHCVTPKGSCMII
jgi:hypothetical protein